MSKNDSAKDQQPTPDKQERQEEQNRLRSSVVEQRYRKPRVVSSTLTVGSEKLNDKPMARSRVKYHLKQQSSRNIFLALGGIIIIIVLVMIYGMDFLVNFSLFVKKGTD